MKYLSGVNYTPVYSHAMTNWCWHRATSFSHQKPRNNGSGTRGCSHPLASGEGLTTVRTFAVLVITRRNAAFIQASGGLTAADWTSQNEAVFPSPGNAAN